MSLQDRLMEDMKAAMKQRESGKLRLSVIRMSRAAVRNIEIDKHKTLSDDEVIEVLAKEVKQRKDSIEEYKKANRQDVVDTLNQEIDILMEYLPEQMSSEEIRQLVQEAISSTDATGPKDMGKVMGKLMPQVKGKADGKLVNQIVKELLS